MRVMASGLRRVDVRPGGRGEQRPYRLMQKSCNHTQLDAKQTKSSRMTLVEPDVAALMSPHLDARFRSAVSLGAERAAGPPPREPVPRESSIRGHGASPGRGGDGQEARGEEPP